MQIRQLTITNFRGIRSLEWRPSSSLACIVGHGDAGKSTILDAIEAVVSARWLQVTDADFPGCDTTKTIEIVATVGELSIEALRDGRMGFYLRGWAPNGLLHDEPADEDEPVVTVRLTVDGSLEPVWELVTDRGEPKTLSGRDRGLFGVVRLGGDAERHLTWGQGSALARLSAEKGQASSVLADAYRKARELVGAGAGTIPALNEVARDVHGAAVGLGAYATTAYSAGLDTQRASMSLGALALHDLGIPVRLAGLGTRRLVTLAIQRLAIPEGAIVLIDELEHGLEPHRIRRALKELREALGPGKSGQVIMTTHSPITVVELAAPQLSVAVRSSAGSVALRSPATSLQAVVRRVPEAFLARRVIVCEGKTEVGLVRALRDHWAARHAAEPIEFRGVVPIDGGGDEAPKTAIELARLGYPVLLFRDADVPLKVDDTANLQTLGVPVLEWPDQCATETRVFRDVADSAIQELLEIAYQARSFESVRDSIRSALGTKDDLARDFSSWKVTGKTASDLRAVVAGIAMKQQWFKRIDTGEHLGVVVGNELGRGLKAPLATTLDAIEAWAYG